MEATADFEPHALLRNGHAMTVAAALMPRTFDVPPAEERLFQVDPESKILAYCHWQPGTRRDVPVMVIVHGLEGSSESNCVHGIAEKVFHRGYHVVRANQRSCPDTEACSRKLYNAGMSSDYRAIVEELSNNDHFEQVFFESSYHITDYPISQPAPAGEASPN